jgi:hypothetical protein
VNEPGANFLYIFSHGKSLSAENSVEFHGKMIFQNFFREKFHFFPTFLGGKFSAEFSPKYSPEKMYEKSAPGNYVHIVKLSVFKKNLPLYIYPCGI